MNRKLRIITASDSVYVITENDNDTYNVRGDNISSITSQPLGETEWAITRPEPWPPVLGQSLAFDSVYFDADYDTPLRMPGGGKRTSPIRLIQTILEETSD